MLEKGATCWNDPTSEVKSANEGEEVPFDAFLPRRPSFEF